MSHFVCGLALEERQSSEDRGLGAEPWSWFWVVPSGDARRRGRTLMGVSGVLGLIDQVRLEFHPDSGVFIYISVTMGLSDNGHLETIG